MWKNLIELVKDVLDLRRQVKGHEQRLDEFSDFAREQSHGLAQLSERLLRVELELQHQKEKQAAEREMFQLRLENLILRYQRDLPPGEKVVSPEEREE